MKNELSTCWISIGDSNFENVRIFHLPEVVGRGSETQPQVLWVKTYITRVKTLQLRAYIVPLELEGTKLLLCKVTVSTFKLKEDVYIRRRIYNIFFKNTDMKPNRHCGK